MTAPPVRTSTISIFALLAAALLAVAIGWSYWTTLAAVVWRWSEDPQYSHGWLVPAFAVYLLWLRRWQLRGQPLAFNGLGLGLIAAALALRLSGTRFHFDYFDQVSLLPCLAGVFLLLGSWPALAWSLPALAFLGFMIPLPHQVSLAMSAPMQSFATESSTFLLQVLGRPALADGNVILLNEVELGIVEACSGLRMLVTFFALSTAIAMLIRKPLWERFFIAFSAIPIALLANVVRITLTGLYYDSFGHHADGVNVHDLFGYGMPVFGMVFLGVELWVLRMLLLDSAGRASLPSQPSPQHGEINPVALYRSGQPSRREKAAAAQAAARHEKAQAEPVAAEEPAQVPV